MGPGEWFQVGSRESILPISMSSQMARKKGILKDDIDQARNIVDKYRVNGSTRSITQHNFPFSLLKLQVQICIKYIAICFLESNFCHPRCTTRPS